MTVKVTQDGINPKRNFFLQAIQIIPHQSLDHTGQSKYIFHYYHIFLIDSLSSLFSSFFLQAIQIILSHQNIDRTGQSKNFFLHQFFLSYFYFSVYSFKIFSFPLSLLSFFQTFPSWWSREQHLHYDYESYSSENS